MMKEGLHQHVFLLENLAEIDESVAHTTERGIDAHICHLSNIFKADILIDTHLQHFTLLIGKELHQLSNLSVKLLGNHLLLDRRLTTINDVENIEFAVGFKGGHSLHFAEIVDF